MHPVSKSFALWLALIALVGFNTLYLIKGFTISKFSSDIFALALLTYMAAFTTPDAFIAIKEGIKTGSQRFIVSFWLVWMITLIHRFWITIIAVIQFMNNNERPIALVESPVSLNIAVLFGIAALYGAIAPITDTPKMARHGYITMLVSAVIAALVVGITIGVYAVSGLIIN